MKYDSLGTRMKENYENRSKTYLIRRMPVVIRLDGKAFHTFTKGMKKPFDDIFSNCMVRTMEYLAKNIQGCVFGYTQSDEISLLLIDYKKISSDAWFNYGTQKITSISAGMATLEFNRLFKESVEEYSKTAPVEDQEYLNILNHKILSAIFDSRVFNIPSDEVCNYFIWRQQDATRNAIQMIARANYSHSELLNLSSSVIQDKLFTEKSINFNDFKDKYKRGTSVKQYVNRPGEAEPTYTSWSNPERDYVPIFSKDRQYIEELLSCNYYL